MKTSQMLRSLVAGVVLLFGLSAWHGEAQALDFGDLISILNEMDKVHANPFPVKGAELEGAQDLFDCLANVKDDVGVVNCADTHKNSAFAQKYVGALPPWLDNLIDAYIAIRNENFWGVVNNLGEAAVCIIAQVMAAGLDLCGLVKELVALGEALLDAATAVGKFFADLGSGVYETIACGIFDSCGSGPPPEKLAYNCFFATRVEPDGLQKMEAVDAFAFAAFRDALVTKAKAGGPCPAGQIPQYWKADAGPASKAGQIFTNAVEGAWSANIIKVVLAARDKQRIDYNSLQQINAMAAEAAAQYDAKKTAPKPFLIDRCAADFSVKFGYAHVDRWLIWRMAGKTEIQQQAQKLTNVTSNRNWCEGEFFGKNLDKFAQQFRNFAQSHYCALFGQQLTCTTIAKYEQCVGLMSSVNQADQCRAALASIGNEIAKKIAASFQTGKGASFTSAPSKYPCQIVPPDGGAPISNKPVDLLCTRPTQQHFCEKEYQVLWKSSTKVLNCATPPSLIPAAYAAQMQKVKQAVATLKAKYPSVGIDKYDPLLVHAGKLDVYDALKKADGARQSAPPNPADVDFTFLPQVSENIDGVSRPTFVATVLLEKPEFAGMPPSLKGSIVKPGDPDPFTKPATGAAQPGLTAQVAPAAAAAVAAQAAAVAGQPSKVMSGPAPGSANTARSAQQPESSVAQGGQPATANPQGVFKSERDFPKGERDIPKGDRARVQSTLPAVQSPTTGTAASTMPQPQRSQLPAVQSPSARSQLPAVQSPPATVRAPTTGSSAPNWSSLGSGTPAPVETTTRGAPPTLAANVAPATAEITRQMNAVSCSADRGGLRFRCTTRTGFDRCEALRAQHKVEQCTLNERR